MKIQRTKRDHEKAARTTISMPPRLLEFAEGKIRALGYSSLSGYVQELIRKEMPARDAATA